MCFSRNNNNSSQFFFQQENVRYKVYTSSSTRTGNQGRGNKRNTFMEESEEENDFGDINTGNDFFDNLINKNRQLNKERRQEDKQRTRHTETEQTENQSSLSIAYGIILTFIRGFVSICILFFFVFPYLFPQRNYRR